jgi:hypothetical protein
MGVLGLIVGLGVVWVLFVWMGGNSKLDGYCWFEVKDYHRQATWPGREKELFRDAKWGVR